LILAAVAVALVVVVGAITWVAVAGGDDDGSSASTVEQANVRNGGPQVGDRAPDFTATTLDGKAVSLSDYAGKPVILNFWASWCNPCRQEFPLFRDQLARHEGDYVMLGVDNRDIASDARRFARQQRADWPIAFDSSNAVYKAYGAVGLPQTFFIKPDGTIAARYYAAVPDERKFAAALAKITHPSST
jgi:cytochrome c biogenesis protein CcmG/thiol:disulfide interchange protein DsbE